MLRSRRFLPLFCVQAFGAFTDNVLKSAFAFLVAFHGLSLFGTAPGVSLMIGTGAYVVPLLLFSGSAGKLADCSDKTKIVRITRLIEIPLALLAAAALFTGHSGLVLLAMFAYATQSAFFGPAKYAILPQHLPEERLIQANALIETSTFVAILAGTLFGGFLAAQGLIEVVMACLLVLAVTGYGVSRFIPAAPPASDAAAYAFAPLKNALNALAVVSKKVTLLRSAVGISWFWAVGLIVISIFPDVAKRDLGVSANVANALIGSFVLGIAAGTALVTKLLKDEVSARHVPLGALGMALCLVDLSFAVSAYGAATANGAEAGMAAFFSSWPGLRIAADMIGLAAFGGMFTVPLYTLLQARSQLQTRSSAIAGNNILNGLVMVALLGLTTLLLALGVKVQVLLFCLGIANFLVAIYVVKLIPDEVVKAIGATLLRRLFATRVINREHYGDGRSPAVVVANHSSYLDAILLGCLLPGKPAFAINAFVAKKWWVRPAFLFFDLIPVDPTSPLTVRTMVKLVKEQKRRLVIFPEGRLTVTGALMKIYDGPAMIAAKAGAPIIPLRIEGAQHTIFSRLKGKLRRRLFPKITLNVLPARSIEVPEDLRGRAARAYAGARLHDIMTEMVFETSPREKTLFQGLIDAHSLHGKRPVLEDIERNPIGYRRIMTGAFALAAQFKAAAPSEKRLGLLLPNANAAVVSFFACHACGKTPAMLNFTAGAAGIRAALAAAEIRTVITSRRFVSLGKLEPLIEEIGQQATILYLEDIRPKIGFLAKLSALTKASFPRLALRLQSLHKISPDDEAAVLFTSGSEGLPKGVVLSHVNIQANRYQVSAMVDFSHEDTVLNALPMFHSFGLTAGTLLPLLSGVKTFLYPSPLHYRIVPEVAYDCNATILFGTDTFLSGYARMAHAYDFYSLRLVFAGAERLRPETRSAWAEKFGVRVLEGYGVTETSPVLAVNTPMKNRPGTAGRLLPGMTLRIDPVPGIDEGGRLHVRGPNVMLGYLRAENPGVLEPPAEGWHDTGDIVTLDDDGFIRICGRAKRFAKIGGEMVSLAAIEALAAEVWPGVLAVALAMPHPRKGEQIVLLTEGEDCRLEALTAHAKAKGVAEIMLPRAVQQVDALPVLGTGKLDYVGAAKLLDQAAAA
ncbi:acyl-[ACP]--phospholipid O-acyltransferase [Pelagibius litoralis]|uniref:Acyl-[ACP]--phospholipid O-acyltransferase n=1 Tax=Pelagibius litoralis TaxID=374515 RepID=A0A967EYX0_9PROT|nr:acyl-[ACP]--phospholipid O-acyltransferase [Pelagibius litoralis]